MTDNNTTETEDTRVFLSKMEGIGQVIGRDGQYRFGPYASRHRLVVFPGEPVLGVDVGNVLREQVERAISEEGGCNISTRGCGVELSREYLLELAEKARPRAVIAAERERAQTI